MIPGARKLLDAIEHFKEKEGAIDKTAPVTFLDPAEVVAVNKDSKFRVSLYRLNSNKGTKSLTGP